MYLQVQRKCVPDNVVSVCTYKYNVNVYLYVYKVVYRCYRMHVVLFQHFYMYTSLILYIISLNVLTLY